MALHVLNGKYTLQKPLATNCTAFTNQLAIVVSRAIIAGKFFTFFNYSQAVKFHPAIANPQISIGFTAMVNVTQIIGVYTCIKCPAITKFNHGNPLRKFCPLPCLPKGYYFATQIAYLFSTRNFFIGKCT